MCREKLKKKQRHKRERIFSREAVSNNINNKKNSKEKRDNSTHSHTRTHPFLGSYSKMTTVEKVLGVI